MTGCGGGRATARPPPFDFREAEAKLRDRGERPQPIPWAGHGTWAVRARAPSTIAAANAGTATGATPAARRMTVASSCVRPAVRASAKAASSVLENIGGVSRIHAPRAIAGAPRSIALTY